ncbi:hypothetical protein BegalDRAFT_1863 [Beggiatoa alba B18LD]|uniref:DUF3592 domain-containing protein n=1 Tax=Beggiatoa alba B18LD TaxID=395493 RepID=I3CGJ4_9GAMM|nr:DUF3592 domain-containing protein [Beggiatoa alba]EIJ42737.1 hypothetical protein BegalDRAFT_1863 [Beggiatoa alba B18LD]
MITLLFLLALMVTLLMVAGMMFVFLSSKIADLQLLERAGQRVRAQIMQKQARSRTTAVSYVFNINQQTYQNTVLFPTPKLAYLGNDDTVEVVYQADDPSENYATSVISDKINDYHQILRIVGIAPIVLFLIVIIYWYA